MPKTPVNSSEESQRDQAYRGLHRLLILQQIEAGQRLREPEWAQRLGVHRSALREAFVRLEAEGLVERGPQTGYFVPVLSEDDLVEINKLRVALECLAIDEICAKPNELGATLGALGRACDEFEGFLRGGYWLGVIEADRRFHEVLISAPGLRRLADLYRRAPLPMIHGATEDRPAWESACTRTLAEHRRIVAALAARDGGAAKSVLREHLANRPMLPICR